MEKLKQLLKMKDMIIDIYDEYRFNNANTNYQNFKKVKEMQSITDELINTYLTSHPEFTKVVVSKTVIIEPGQTLEVKTNITGSHNVDDIIFEGFIPTSGYLEFLCSYNEKVGNEIFVKNTVKREVFENWNKGYHYCDPTTTRYFDSGVYELKEGTVIGIAITKQKDKENNGIQYVLNNGNN